MIAPIRAVCGSLSSLCGSLWLRCVRLAQLQWWRDPPAILPGSRLAEMLRRDLHRVTPTPLQQAAEPPAFIDLCPPPELLADLSEFMIEGPDDPDEWQPWPESPATDARTPRWWPSDQPLPLNTLPPGEPGPNRPIVVMTSQMLGRWIDFYA